MKNFIIFLACIGFYSTYALNDISSDAKQKDKSLTITLAREMFYLKNQLFLACKACDASGIEAALNQMRHPLSEGEQADAFKEIITYCPQKGGPLVDIFYQHGFIRDGRQRDGQTNLLLASMQAANTCQFEILNQMLKQKENPDYYNAHGGTLIATISIFDLYRRKPDCLPCTWETYNKLQDYSTVPPQIVEVTSQPTIFVQSDKQNATSISSENPSNRKLGIIGQPTEDGNFTNHEQLNKNGKHTIWRWIRDQWNRIVR